MSWPGWLTYSGRLTHISGHPSATGGAQDGERTLARDWRSTAEPRGPTEKNDQARILVLDCLNFVRIVTRPKCELYVKHDYCHLRAAHFGCYPFNKRHSVLKQKKICKMLKTCAYVHT